MSMFTGTGRLVRLALRRDRIKLPVWAVVIALLFASTIPAVKEIYAIDAADRTVYAVTNASSIITRVLSGPIGGPDLGAIVLQESYLFAAVLIAFMSTLAVIRHTRQNEEMGSAELIGSGVVGRYAMPTAALLVTAGACGFIGISSALVLIGGGLPVAGSWAAGMALAGTGVAFAAVAAVTAQLSESSRGANSLAASAIGVAFMLRAIGDGLGTITQQGTVISSAWPSYLSPIGWGEQVFPYTACRRGFLALYAVVFVSLTGLAFFLTSRRDIGMGLLASRPGPSTARHSLLSPAGLVWRLQKGTFFGWLAGLVIFGLATGLMAKEFRSLIEQNEAFAEAMKRLAGASDASEALVSALLVFAGVTVSGFAVQSLQRLHTEETTGHAELILSTAIGRYRWMLSHVCCTVAGVVVLLVVGGVAAMLSYGMAMNLPVSHTWHILGATLTYIPAVLVVGGVSVMLFGILPRLHIGLSWGMFCICIGLLQLGSLLQLPQWVMNVSPFTHTPSAPAEPVTLVPLIIMTLLAIVFGVVGLYGFRRRDSIP